MQDYNSSASTSSAGHSKTTATTTMSPQRQQSDSFSNVSSQNNPITLKPSPRSSLVCTPDNDTPSLAGEPSFHEDEDFFLLSPEELPSAESLTFTSSPRTRLLPRPNPRWSKSFSSVRVVHFPRANRKRSREDGFVLKRKTMRYDSDYLGEVTASTVSFPEVTRDVNADELLSQSHVFSTPIPSYTQMPTSPPLIRRAPDCETRFYRCNSHLVLPVLM